MKKITTDGHIWELVSESPEVWKAPDGLLWGPRLEGTYTFEQAQQVANTQKLLGKKWHVPTRKEWLQFEIFDGREVLTDMHGWFWSSSPAGNFYAWALSGIYGNVDNDYRYDYNSVRCAGR